MSVKFSIPNSSPGQEKIKFKIGQAEAEKASQAKKKLKARRTIDNNIIITDHPHCDIIVYPGEHKIVTIPKDVLTDDVFETQHELYRYLFKKGVLIFDSLQGGNIYGALEAQYPTESTIGDPLQLVLFAISKFMENEREWFEYVDEYFEDQTDKLLEPDAEHSTDLGEVPHSETKGSMRYVYNPYGVAYRLHEIREYVGEVVKKNSYGLLAAPKSTRNIFEELLRKKVAAKVVPSFLLARPE